MSDSVRPHRQQPTRLPRPWNSPGKNTGVGCHFLLQCMKVKSESEVAQSCPTLHDPMDWSLPGSSTHGIFQARVLEWGAIAWSKLLLRLSALPFFPPLSSQPVVLVCHLISRSHCLVFSLTYNVILLPTKHTSYFGRGVGISRRASFRRSGWAEPKFHLEGPELTP